MARALEAEPTFPPWLLNIGFMTALVLATICLLAGGYYLYRFQGATQASVLNVLDGKRTPPAGVFQLALMAQMYLARVQLLSCGIFIGMAFGFLGFGLFLLGVKGQIDAEGSSKALTLKVLNLSPGVFVLLCATILIGTCATRSLPFGYGQGGNGSARPAAAAGEADVQPSPAASGHDITADDSEPHDSTASDSTHHKATSSTVPSI
jgi:hypothetical protein